MREVRLTDTASPSLLIFSEAISGTGPSHFTAACCTPRAFQKTQAPAATRMTTTAMTMFRMLLPRLLGSPDGRVSYS